MRSFLPSIHEVPEALAGVADDLQGLAFLAVFQLAARFDGPAMVVFDVAERVDTGVRTLAGVPARLLQGNLQTGSEIADVAAE